MLAAGILARKYGTGTADILGKLHEFKTSPLQALKMLMGKGEMPHDYKYDLHNNQLGASLGTRVEDQAGLEQLLKAMADRSTVGIQQGRAALPPKGKAKGGEVKKDADQVSDDPIGDFLDDYEMEQLRKKIAENEAALIDLTPVPTRVETGSDPMLLDVYPRLQREMEANPERYEYGTARLKDEEFIRPMLRNFESNPYKEDFSKSEEDWLEYKLRPRGQSDFSDRRPPGMELFNKKRRSVNPRDPYYAQGGLVEYDPDHIESLAQGLHMYESEEGLAPHGLRHAGDSVKGKGYYGLIPARGGRMSTEISAEDAEGEFPLLVPGLTSEEIESLTNEEYPESVYKKAVAHAQKRRSQNKSPFSGIDELRYPLPSKFASGGAVNYNQSHIDELAAQFHKEM
jgi:hypothetical protein